ncbi:MAG TPA: lyase family protein, partial [Lacunisphaera sp.]|nr:lyase family protein [Lacunisphaera sp.]
MTDFRMARDSMGEIAVPKDALWGASTQRAVQNFPISGRPLPAAFIRALALVKLAAARANAELELLEPAKAGLIGLAAREIADGRHADQFPIDIFQTGSGTSTHTNVNEVIARRAAQLAPPDAPAIHPNDDVNLGQSSNDVVPTALHVAVAQALRQELAPALALLADSLEKKAISFGPVVKLGRTHLMDATPLTLGQEF